MAQLVQLFSSKRCGSLAMRQWQWSHHTSVVACARACGGARPCRLRENEARTNTVGQRVCVDNMFDMSTKLMKSSGTNCILTCLGCADAEVATTAPALAYSYSIPCRVRTDAGVAG